MREISTDLVKEKLKAACGRIAMDYNPDILTALKAGRRKETDQKSMDAMDMLLENAEIASKERIPICQDTGMAVVYIQIGQEVHVTGGSLKDAVNQAVAEGYTENYLRASVVDDPLFERKNTKNNTPAVIYFDLVPGDTFKIFLMAKGFGSENMSRIAMLKPAQGLKGAEDFILETIAQAGPNSCPPFIVGVGIGGTFDYSAVLAKKALLRPLDHSNPDERYKKMEDELLDKANKLHVGPMGLHGNTTALKIQIEATPTHIAGLPVAVNMCCHACRHCEIEL